MHFLSSLQKRFSSFLKKDPDKVFKQETQEWIKLLQPNEIKSGRYIVQRIVNARKSQDTPTLDLSGFKVSLFPSKLITKWIPKLTSANFSGLTIQNVHFLNQLTDLETLKMNDCKISKIVNVTLPKLKHLELTGTTNITFINNNKKIFKPNPNILQDFSQHCIQQNHKNQNSNNLLTLGDGFINALSPTHTLSNQGHTLPCNYKK
jgi:hypothetical protein